MADSDFPKQPSTDIEIANAALAMIGSMPIASFDADDARTRQVLAVYEPLVRAEMASHNWTFVNRTKLLTQLADPPDSGYTYAHALPADRVGPPSLIRIDRALKTPLRDFRLEADAIHSDSAVIYAVCPLRVGVELWGAAFLRFIIRALAAELAIPITQNAEFAAQVRAEAYGSAQEQGLGGLKRAAIAEDARSHPGPAPMQGDPVTQARLGGATGDWWG